MSRTGLELEILQKEVIQNGGFYDVTRKFAKYEKCSNSGTVWSYALKFSGFSSFYDIYT